MEELLICSVCCEGYTEKGRNPVVLPRCGHSFCRPCMHLMENGGCIVCPTCRTDQRVGSVAALPTEYTLLAIIHARENIKLEECPIHSVKLSFWCKTCATATCGECLFEDHPTHSHVVVRAPKYIQEIKDDAQDVANKFIDILDKREKTYYKHIFHYARKISNAIRNILVLRKDMDNARELMKGMKDQESLRAATSLAEATKFLGLKWNIQDANFNQNQSSKEETIKEEKERESPNNKEVSSEIKPTEEEAPPKKKLKDKKDKEDKPKKLSLRKSKTLSVFEPKLNNESVEDNKEREEREEAKSKKLTPSPKPTRKLSSNTMPPLPEVEVKEEEVKKESNTLLRPNTPLSKMITKSKTQLFDPIDDKINSIEIDNNPDLEDKLSIARKFRKKSLLKDPIISKEDEAATNLPEIIVEEKIDENLDEKIEPEKEDKGSEDNSKEEVVEAKNEEESENLKEEDEKKLTEESKEEKEDENAKAEAKLMDIMDTPEFTVCMEGMDGKIARTEWSSEGLMVFCHQFQAVEYDVCLKSSMLHSLLPSKRPIAFLEISAGETVLGTVYIELWGHLRRAQNFLTLCLGDMGVSFLLTKFLQVYNLGGEGERLLGGDYEYNNGRGGKEVLCDLEWNGEFARPMERGMVTAAGSGQGATNSLFLICTNSDAERSFSCPFGQIRNGFEFVEKAIIESQDKQIWITNCGALIETKY